MLPHRIGGGNDSGLLPGGRFRCHRLEVGLEAHSLYCSQLSGLPPFSCSSRRRSTVPDPTPSPEGWAGSSPVGNRCPSLRAASTCSPERSLPSRSRSSEPPRRAAEVPPPKAADPDQ